jgi:hypothetical protein
VALIESIVGERKAGANVQADIRGGPYSELIVNDVGLGKFFEGARLGRVYTARSLVGVALATATPLGAGGTAPFALWNPAATGKAAVILKASVQQVAGATPVPNLPFWDFASPTAAITATVNGIITPATMGTAASSMKAFSAAALTGSTVCTAFRPWHTGGSTFGAATVAASVETLVEETDGTIIVPPAGLLAVTFNVTGTNITGTIAVTFAEVDWPLL